MQPPRADAPGLAPIMHALGNGPLLIDPGWLEAAIAASAQGGDLSWFTGRWDPQNRINVTDDGIAIARVHGVMVARGPWLGSIWGCTSYEGLAEQFKRLAADPAVRQVVLDIDSGGGMAAGLWDLMPALDALKAKKRVTAIANPFAASAAYAIACAADEFYVGRTAQAGSIGVVRQHMDVSSALEKWGYRPTLFTAGRMKAAGNSYEPLTPEVRAYIQAGVDKIYGEFVDHVAKYRGVAADAVRATEARVYCAEDAVALRLADGVTSFDELIDQLRTPKSARSRATTPTGGNRMTTASGASLSQGDLEKLTASIVDAITPKAVAPAPVAAAPAVAAAQQNDTVSRAEAERMSADAAAKAVKADRERTAAVMALDESKGHEGRALQLAHETGMSVEQIKAFLADLPKPAAAATSGNPFANALAVEMAKGRNAANVKPEAKAEPGAASAGMPSLADSIAARFADAGAKKKSR